MEKRKYKIKNKDITKLNAFYDKLKKEISKKDGKRNLSR